MMRLLVAVIIICLMGCATTPPPANVEKPHVAATYPMISTYPMVTSNPVIKAPSYDHPFEPTIYYPVSVNADPNSMGYYQTGFLTSPY